jgi:hypothetical protein
MSRLPKTKSQKETSQALAVEQRREPRRPAHGTVRIGRATGAAIGGRLIDISANGFRAAHPCATLASGEIVSYSHEHSEGQARVVWTRVTTGSSPSVESGFMVLTEI